MGLNRVMLIGRAVRSADLRWISEHQGVAEFPIRVEKTYRTANGQEKTASIEVLVQAYGALAERCAKVPAGCEDVLVEGRLKLDVWTDGESKQHQRYSVVAMRCEFEGADVAPGPTPGPTPEGPKQRGKRVPRETPAAAA